MVSGALLVRWINPADIGLWQSVRLATVYSMFALAGVNNGLSRDLPYYMGKSDEKTSRLLASTALMYLIGAGALVLVGGCGCLLVFRSLEKKVLFAITTVTVLIIATFYTNYLIVTFRSSKSFSDLSKVKLAEGFCGLATIPLFFYLGYNGMLIRVMVLAGIVLLLMHLLRPVRVSPSWDWSAFSLLLKTGVPIFLLDYFGASASTCDRLVLLHSGGVTAVGYYTLALMVRDSIGIVPGSMSEYIYPRMSYSYGKHGEPLLLWKMAVKFTILLVVIMVPIAVAGWFLMPPVVSTLFPKYTEAVSAAQLMLIVGVVAGATSGKSVLLSMKAWKVLVWYQILGSGSVIVGPIVGAMCCPSPLIGVSRGLLVASLVWCPIAWYLIYITTHCTASNMEAKATTV